MKTRDEDYELGRDVTNLALSGGGKRDMAVLSVRLPASEIARLEKIGHESGKTVSQVVRDAIAAYRVNYPATSVGLWNGMAFIVGTEPEGVSCNAHYRVESHQVGGFSTGVVEVPLAWGAGV